ncbi:hypothetical protein N864_14135 [Intrasporangium chromatireducens Q5-1]|uniref:DUF3352 domain-containing protein n=1 Tax=Intrasporangium chromatireducens Q5-1 TaxID=584657 RepID=W9GJJ7_9MICO|nr:DUF3352 domain-containing protein [Intrasporangium chromatireducens]EWT04029.1 hypothetical protein N864_14135 [Intrasporangium chromatireducens Q5-1]
MTQPNDPRPEPTSDPTPEQLPGSSETAQPTQSIPQPSQSAGAPTQYSYPTEGTTSGLGGAAGIPPSTLGAGAAEGVSFSDDAAPRTSRRRTGLIAGGLVAALALGGGIAFGVSKLSGGGAQPADVIPGDALAYVRLDIDPSAGQKIAAVRFLSKIPGARDVFSSDDMRQKLWEQVVKESKNACLKKFDFGKDIQPWLGQRAGLGFRPGKTGGEQNMVIALQTSDESTASDTLARLTACSTDSKDKTDIRTRDGYVLLTPKGQGDTTLAALDKGSLASNATFSGDMSALGDQGVASMWFDNAKFAALAQQESGTKQQVPDTLRGRSAFTLRFDPSYIEMAGIGRGLDAVKQVSGSGAELGRLPADTIGAFQLSGGDQLLDGAWPELKKGLDSVAGGGGDVQSMLESELGITLPDDLKVLLGKSFTLSVPDQAFGSQLPTVGLKVTGTNAKRAEEVLTSIEDVSGGALSLDKKADGDRLYASTTPGYAGKLATDGKLADSETFKTALGDTSKMTVGFYLDLDRIEKYYLPDVGPEAHDAVQALRAVGLNVWSTGDGEGSFSLRLVGN